PSAYFVDLLQFLKSQPVGTGTVRDKLIARRPDLPVIELSCANATKRLPFIDLVNEILEVSLWQQLNGGAAWPTTPATVATTATEDELLAAPEIVYPVPFSAAY